MNKLLALTFALFSLGAFASPNSGPNLTSVRTLYSSTNVDTSTPLVLVSSMSHVVKKISIFDSSGQVMELIISQGGQTDKLIISPGGGDFAIGVSKGASVSILALSASATAGENDINFFY